MILIAEDSPVDALILRNIVEHTGHAAMLVSDGAEALSALKEHPDIQLVLADICMPELDGVALLKAMLADPKTVGIPVVFVTGVDEAEKVREAVSLRPAGYILKPLTEPSQILARIERLLDAREVLVEQNGEADGA